ncbi:DNA polymerase III subunit beta family protein [Streptomyces daliensis]
MPPSELMPIGVFAQRSGLTASALRFYADSGLLRPAETDPASGYRYYGVGQVARATALRALREIAMPLPVVAAVLEAEPGEASRLIDEHVAKVLGDAAAVRRKAAAIKSSLADVPGVLDVPGAPEDSGEPIASLMGPVLADAVEQVLAATVSEPELPVLGGLRMEATPEALTLTATDRYRLSTRTLVPVEPPTRTWAATVSGDELRTAVAEVRRSALVRIEADPHGIRLRVADRGRQNPHCRLLPQEFPDHKLLLASLDEVTTRVTVAKDALLRGLEEHPGERVTLQVTGDGVRVLPADGTLTGAARPGTLLPATVTGRDLLIRFELTTLYPAVSTAIGPDVLLDLRGSDQPGTVRSADRGDLTTLAMPVGPRNGGTST